MIMVKKENNINKEKLLTQLKERLEDNNFKVPMSALKLITAQFLKLIIENVRDGKEVQIQNFGKWYIKKMKSAMRQSPNQTEKVYVPEYDAFKFSASRKMREVVRYKQELE